MNPPAQELRDYEMLNTEGKNVGNAALMQVCILMQSNWLKHRKNKAAGDSWVAFPQQIQISILQRVIKFAQKPRREQLLGIRYHLEERDWYWKIRKPGNDRTAYVIGLFGTGRWYISEMMLQNFGKRTKYFRHEIRFHPGPTSLIYTGHATIKYPSRYQALPSVTSRILQAVKSRSADLIFIYRHPLDSLLSNWVWWRTYLRDSSVDTTISKLYKNTDDLCADLDKNFAEFKAFADGEPEFFASSPGPRFLSFPEFVEETELYLEADTLALRLEDFTADPLKEFSKIVKVMSLALDPNRLSIAPPRAKPYGYLTIQQKVPQFRKYINELDAETKRRIKKIGYDLGT